MKARTVKGLLSDGIIFLLLSLSVIAAVHLNHKPLFS